MSTEAAPTVAPVVGPISTVESKDMSSESVSEPTPAVENKDIGASESVPEPTPAVQAIPDQKIEEPTAELTSPLLSLSRELPSIIETASYGELWGVELKDANDVPTSIVLEKFLRANIVEKKKDVVQAKAQLIEALKWRKKMEPRKLMEEVEFDEAKFGGLGYVTIYPQSSGKEIVTWNIYGGVKDIKGTFGNVEEFVKWRAAIMELSVKELDLPSATERISEDGEDPYRMIQVHDYLSVSFLRMDPNIRAASKETIQVFSMAYPELLKEKFFVNVPLVMGWVFTAMKVFLPAATIKKFHPLSYGSNLAGELPSFGQELPVAYGGKGKDVKEGLTVKYTSGATTGSK